MTKKKELKWRLKDLPDACDIADLVKEKVITTDEAREILFKNEESTKLEELQEEVKFLRQMVDKLTDSNNWKIVKEVYKEYHPVYPYWYRKYEPVIYPTYTFTCGASDVTTTGSVTTAGYVETGAQGISSFSSLN